MTESSIALVILRRPDSAAANAGDAADRHAVAWPCGPVYRALATVADLASCLTERSAPNSAPAAWYFHDEALGAPPSPERLAALLKQPDHVWHAGLSLGTAGQPGLLDFVAPTWMLNRDPLPNRPATSWRATWRACLVRHELWAQLGTPAESFATLDGAMLDLGLRWVRLGASCRHTPRLALAADTVAQRINLPLADELRIVRRHFGARWMRWTRWRAVQTRYASPAALRQAARAVADDATTSAPRPWDAMQSPSAAQPPAYEAAIDAKVTVLIPTVDRYDYLRVVLDQLRRQTVLPAEVIVVDQTPAHRRDDTFSEAFADLPLRWLTQDEAGQCASRNAGLDAATGSHVLFIDDDDEIEPDLIERHLRHLAATGADVSCGVADEAGAGELPPDFHYGRVADVFPTNNAMIRGDALMHTGLFDLAYNNGPRADGDLGMRLYLAGFRLRLEPSIRVLHHHAPRGGLRTHKARKVTYATSRSRLFARHLPATTQLYLDMRYFSPLQIREASWIGVVGTLAGRGPRWRRLLKFAIGLACLPHTLWTVRRRTRHASRMLESYPRIPALRKSAAAATANSSQDGQSNVSHVTPAQGAPGVV